MIQKADYLKKIYDATEIMNRRGLGEAIASDAARLEAFIHDYSFRVVMIGGFSSGKSAFLNRLLDRPLLKVSQLPETAVAAELVCAKDDDEYGEAIFTDGRIERFSIENATQDPPSGAAFLILHVNSPYLKERPELALVDFPGLDSNIEAHDKAITGYIERGSAFILFLPATSGTIRESEIRFLREAAHYRQGLACFVSKADQVAPEQAAEAAKHIQQSVSTLYGADVSVEPISSSEGMDPNFVEKATAAIDSFEPQKLFDLGLAAPINSMLLRGIGAISSAIDAQQLSTDEIDRKIKMCEKQKNDLKRTFEREKAELNRKFDNEIIPGIIGRLDDALRMSAENLTEAAMSGQARFSSAVQSIIRPILADVPGKINVSLREMIGNMTPPSHDGDDDRGEELSDAIRTTLVAALDAIGSIPMSNISGGQQPNGASGTGGAQGSKTNANIAGAATSATAGVAVSMGLINPVLGVVIALAPVASSLIDAFSKSRRQQGPNPRDQVRQYVINQAIPDIMSRTQSEITPAVYETRNMMLEELQRRASEALQAEEKALASAKAEADDKKEDHNKKLEELKNDLAALEALLIKEA